VNIEPPLGQSHAACGVFGQHLGKCVFAAPLREFASAAGLHFGTGALLTSLRERRIHAPRPNPSLNRTLRGRRRKPGAQWLRHCRAPGLRRLPLRAG
jgi:hypothetical protein